MKIYTEEEITKKYKELPEDVRTAIFAVDTAQIIEDIGGKYRLTVDKMGDLSNEIRVLMLGTTEPKDFISSIARRLEVDKKTAHDITEEVNEKIFSKIRDSLKKIHNIADEEESDDSEREIKAPATEATKPIESPSTQYSESLSREDILKGIEEPEPTPVPTEVPKKEPVSMETDKELSISPPPPTVIKEGSESSPVTEQSKASEVVKDVDAVDPKHQFSRRPPEVSEHDGSKPLGPGGDKYPEGDPYREPVK